MLVKKAEMLVFLKLADSISQADECLLDLIHPLAEAALQDYMQADLDYQQHTEFLPIGQANVSSDYTLNDVQFRSGSVRFVSGNAGTEFLQLKHLPVLLTGLRVWEDVGAYGGQTPGSFSHATELTVGNDFFLDLDDPSADLSRSGIIKRVGAWPVEPRSVKVVYYGGYTAAQMAGRIAGAVKLAAMQTIAACFWNGKQVAESKGLGPKMSESIGKYSYTLGQFFAAGNMTFTVPPDAKSNLQPHRNYGRAFG